MSATIHTLPHRPKGADHALYTGQIIRESFAALPPRDDELLIHCAMAEVALARAWGLPCQTITQVLRDIRAA